jgi:tryptophan halogenase
MEKYWDSIRDWIRMHYFTQRKDSEFWKETSNLSISQELSEKMETFKFRMPRENDCIPGEIYQNSLTFHVLNGMELLDAGIAQKELDFYGLEETARNKYQEILKNDQIFIKNFVSHKYYLDNI